MYKTFNYPQLVTILPYLATWASTPIADTLGEILNFLSGVVVNDHDAKKQYKFDHIFSAPLMTEGSMIMFIFKETYDYKGPEEEKQKPPVIDNLINNQNNNENQNYDNTRLGGPPNTGMSNHETGRPSQASRNEGINQVRT